MHIDVVAQCLIMLNIIGCSTNLKYLVINGFLELLAHSEDNFPIRNDYRLLNLLKGTLGGMPVAKQILQSYLLSSYIPQSFSYKMNKGD